MSKIFSFLAGTSTEEESTEKMSCKICQGKFKNRRALTAHVTKLHKFKIKREPSTCETSFEFVLITFHLNFIYISIYISFSLTFIMHSFKSMELLYH